MKRIALAALLILTIAIPGIALAADPRPTPTVVGRPMHTQQPSVTLPPTDT